MVSYEQFYLFSSLCFFFFVGLPSGSLSGALSGGANVAQFQSLKNQSEGTNSINQTFYIYINILKSWSNEGVNINV